MTRKKLDAHRAALQPLLRKRKPEQFDASAAALKLKSEIQRWNREALRLLKGTPGGQTSAKAFEALGRMSYGTLTDVRTQLRARQEVIDGFLAAKPAAAKRISARLPAVKAKSRESNKAYPFDVCLSFAGEDRKFVHQVYEALTAAGVKTFYDRDADIESELWGSNLYEYLDDIYRNQARFCIMFLSRNYVKKAWTRLERESAQARAFLDHQAYILPVRLDDTEVPGVRSTTGFLTRSNGVQRIVNATLQKLKRPTPVRVKTESARKPGTSGASRGLAGHVVLLGDRLYQARRVTRAQDESLELELNVRGPEDRAALRTLAPPHFGYRKVRFVDRLDALDVQVSLLSETTTGRVSTMTLRLVPVQAHGTDMRINFMGQAPEIVAERQLRQLLLGEAPEPVSFAAYFPELPNEVRGGVLPYALRQAGELGQALQLAALLATYYIRSLNLVDHIRQMNFSRTTAARVTVVFKGSLKVPGGQPPVAEVNLRGTVSLSYSRGK
ncbi:toll/interleukin-1 receptor domain-containing protein [Deinococcus humi]|uniref:TIR domain-containing protein n=1 Tax=Deinococcus humi TaxID=662880 RepID=A0A7W8JZ37_9DEIO|nr:TIR domain-containing protein [Deinococcus humi]MBB5364329.1 hypothetical protein [Deinococcus humi]GGO33525.1 hypothetical protein GCM10008949_32840 [Deinococcus humi]